MLTWEQNTDDEQKDINPRTNLVHEGKENSKQKPNKWRERRRIARTFRIQYRYQKSEKRKQSSHYTGGKVKQDILIQSENGRGEIIHTEEGNKKMYTNSVIRRSIHKDLITSNDYEKELYYEKHQEHAGHIDRTDTKIFEEVSAGKKGLSYIHSCKNGSEKSTLVKSYAKTKNERLKYLSNNVNSMACMKNKEAGSEKIMVVGDIERTDQSSSQTPSVKNKANNEIIRQKDPSNIEKNICTDSNEERCIIDSLKNDVEKEKESPRKRIRKGKQVSSSDGICMMDKGNKLNKYHAKKQRAGKGSAHQETYPTSQERSLKNDSSCLLNQRKRASGRQPKGNKEILVNIIECINLMEEKLSKYETDYSLDPDNEHKSDNEKEVNLGKTPISKRRRNRSKKKSMRKGIGNTIPLSTKKPGSDNEILVAGNVKSAKASEKYSTEHRCHPTHFLAFRIYNKDIISKANVIQEDVLIFNKDYKPAFVDTSSLHVTLAVFSAMGHEMKKVFKALEESLGKLKDIYCDDADTFIEFDCLNSFDKEVVYMAVKKTKGSEFLQLLVSVLRNSLAQQGISVQKDTFTPHATIMKLRKSNFFRKKHIKKIPTDLYATHKEEFFGKEEIREVLLCSMAGKKPGNFYKVLASLDLMKNEMVINVEGKGLSVVVNEVINDIIDQIEDEEHDMKNEKISDVVNEIVVDIIDAVERGCPISFNI